MLYAVIRSVLEQENRSIHIVINIQKQDFFVKYYGYFVTVFARYSVVE